MRAYCVCNDGFVDNLTRKKYYEVIRETKHGFIIEDDLGIEWEYSKSRFDIFR